MGPVDFFAQPEMDCAKSSACCFYLYDDGESGPVYLDEVRRRRNCTPVENTTGEIAILRPVDHVLYPESGGPVHCDAFLHNASCSCLCFVELKCVRTGWINESVKQLEQTVLDFAGSHKDVFLLARHRRAVAANPKHPNFNFSEAMRIRNFHAKTGFVLFLENLVRMD